MKRTSFIFLLIMPLSVLAQQVADTTFSFPIRNPAYQSGSGSLILIDEAHNNFHTRNGRYLPFTRVLEKDGYVVKSSNTPFAAAELSGTRILVIANALHASNVESWTVPTPSAFTDEEIKTLYTWVNEGGSLFLIADHMPFPGATEKLAAAFGVEFINGFAMSKKGEDIFKLNSGLIASRITAGRNNSETITSVQSFTGQAFRIPPTAQPILVLNDNFEVKIPETAWEFDKNTTVISGKDLVQGAYMTVGKGRVVIFGEAAMFTAQLQGKKKMGMNKESADQNVQFLLNVIHWLDGLIP